MTVTPPDQTVWWDVTATVAEVLDWLRLTDTDIDVALLEALVPVVGHAHNVVMDRVDPLPTPTPPDVQYALVLGVIARYTATRAGPGDPTDYAAAISYSLNDPYVQIRRLLGAHKQRVGVA